MASPLTDAEREALAVSVAEGRIVRLRDRITRLKDHHRPTENYETLLQTLEESLELRKQRLERQKSDLVGYRCYMMIGEHIAGVEVLRCPDDAEAMVRAADLLDAKPQHGAVEIWERGRLVGRIVRPA